MNFTKNLIGYSKISIQTKYLLEPRFPYLDKMELLSDVLCIKNNCEHVMIQNYYEEQILALNHSILPKEDQQDGETLVVFNTDIDLEKIPVDFSHIAITLTMLTKWPIPGRKLLDCLITVTDQKSTIIFYHELPGNYQRINCITILDIFRDENYWWSLRPVGKNILDIPKYLLFGEP